MNVEKLKSAIREWSELRKLWKGLLDARLAAVKTAKPSTDHDTILRVNELAWSFAADEGNVLPHDHRFDLSHVPYDLEKWHRAAKTYKDLSGIDGQEALARHEAAIRKNSTVLHVERR